MCGGQSKLLLGGVGGLFCTENLQSHSLKNRFVTLIFSLGGGVLQFEAKKVCRSVQAVLVPPNFAFRITTQRGSPVIIVHVDPFSSLGLGLTLSDEAAFLSDDLFHQFVPRIEAYVSRAEPPKDSEVDGLLEAIVGRVPDPFFSKTHIDPRVLECIGVINRSEAVSISELATHTSLSTSRLSHLFKDETGITLKQYFQHRKMVKAIEGIHTQSNFTDLAYHGGFADQSHFNHIFRKMFGIKPSKIKK